jgi:MFS transporter, DHA1 family, multidrug resistance protein
LPEQLSLSIDRFSMKAKSTSSTASQHHRLAMLLAGLSAIGPFSTDTYLPSFQEIGRVLHATPVLVQQTLTIYMVMFAAMTLWQGAISDALGRRRVTLAMLAVFFLASLGCMCAWSIESLLFFRAIQGMTAGAGMVIGRAIVRDVLEGAEAQKLMSRVALMFAIAPSVGPVIGGWLHVWLGWRSVFAFLALFSAVLWVWCWRELPETLPQSRRQPLNPQSMARGYWGAATSGAFVALVVAVTLNFSAVFVYIVSAPEFLQHHLHLKETEFLWLFGPITLGILLGTWISGRIAGRWSNRRTLILAYLIMGVTALGNILFNCFHEPMLPWSVLSPVFYIIGSALAMPVLTLMALDIFPERRGLASSCQGFVQSGGNALIAGILAPLAWGSGLSLSLAMGGIYAGGLVSFAVYVLFFRRVRKTDAMEQQR